MQEPIAILQDGCDVVIHLRIPPAINDGKDEYYVLRHTVSNSVIATAATVQRIRAAYQKSVADVREAAYRQGARDRAQKATTFSELLRTDLWKGGCA